MIIFITSYFNLWISLFISQGDYLHETTTTPMNVLLGFSIDPPAGSHLDILDIRRK
jgi:hypothetical protein